MNYRILFICTFIVAALAGNAQIVTVRSGFDADSIQIGEQLTFTISAEADENVIVSLPVYQDSIPSSSVEIIHAGDIDSVKSNGKLMISRNYLVSSFEPGWNTIPPQAIAFNTGSLSDTVYTSAALLTVLVPDVDTTQAIRPIKPPVNTPVSLAEILPWAVVGYLAFMLGTLIAALVWIYVNKKKHPELFPQKPLEPAHIIAFRELDKLLAEKLPQNARVKEYYSRLTDIIRNYMMRQFSIHAMESTTNEILEAFSVQIPDEKPLLEKLGELLMLADLVKFAKEDPSPKENDRHMQNARDFVEQTYRMFIVEEEEHLEAEESIDDVEIVEPVKLEEGNG